MSGFNDAQVAQAAAELALGRPESGQAEEPPVGSIVVDSHGGWPFIHAVGGWYRGDDVRNATWDEVYAWHQRAVDDPDDETVEPFDPILIWPRGEA